MVFLGFGKYARADKIYALEPLRGDERGDGRRTRVWVDGIVEPIVASRTERTILHEMGQDAAAGVAAARRGGRARRAARVGRRGGRASTSPTSGAARAGCSRRPRARRDPQQLF